MDKGDKHVRLRYFHGRHVVKVHKNIGKNKLTLCFFFAMYKTFYFMISDKTVECMPLHI